MVVVSKGSDNELMNELEGLLLPLSAVSRSNPWENCWHIILISKLDSATPPVDPSDKGPPLPWGRDVDSTDKGLLIPCNADELLAAGTPCASLNTCWLPRGEPSGMAWLPRPWPASLTSPWVASVSRLIERCLCRFDGRSLILSDSWRLNGDWAPIVARPRNEFCRSSIDAVACGRSMAYGLWMALIGGTCEGLHPCVTPPRIASRLSGKGQAEQSKWNLLVRERIGYAVQSHRHKNTGISISFIIRLRPSALLGTAKQQRVMRQIKSSK